MSLRLPPRPHLDVLKRQAKSALRTGRLLFPGWQLADAQRALAVGYGHSSWTALKVAVGSATTPLQPGAAMERGHTMASGPLAAPDTPLAGAWIGRPASSDRVALEISTALGGLSLSQVVATAPGSAAASVLLLRPDGHRHPLPFGEGLQFRAVWLNPRQLETTVTRGELDVAHGTYDVSGDGLTLSVTSGGTRRAFDRVLPDGGPATRGVATSARSSGTRRRRRTSAALLLVAGALAGTIACANRAHRPEVSATRIDADVAAIDALNHHDVTAALASDVDAVVSQWTDDFVLILPGAPFVRGKAANAALLAHARPQAEQFEPLAYDVRFEEVVVSGDYAFAWGTFTTAARSRAGGTEVRSSGSLFRVYQRQADGRWLMHRTMATLDPRSDPPRP